MKYFPKSRILTNQTANPLQFATPDGSDYTGPYYTTFTGESFTGKDPSSGDSIPLIPTPLMNENINLDTDTIKKIQYDAIKPNPDANLVDPTPFTPSPTEADYKVGRITRYIARQKGGTQFRVMEIDKNTYDNLTKQRGDVNYSVWRAISIQWQISGPLHDELVNGIKVRPGIIDTNEKVLNQAEKNFIGIKQYLSNPTQFAR
jgi:hypothetical protein